MLTTKKSLLRRLNPDYGECLLGEKGARIQRKIDAILVGIVLERSMSYLNAEDINFILQKRLIRTATEVHELLCIKTNATILPQEMPSFIAFVVCRLQELSVLCGSPNKYHNLPPPHTHSTSISGD